MIENEQTIIAVNEDMAATVKRTAELCLKLEGFERECEISVLLVDDDAIRKINKEHRKIDRPTDVLSFPMANMKNGSIISEVGDYDIDEESLLLGDIVISLERVKKQAGEYGHSFERELAFLTSHGVYHLLGYDHEEPEQEAIMLKKQEAALESMSLTRSGTAGKGHEEE